MRRLALLIWLALAAPAFAGQPVELRASVQSHDGRLTLGDLFDGAGAASGVLIAVGRPDAGLVVDAGRLKAVARAHGLDWANASGLARVIAQSSAADAEAPGLAPAAAPVRVAARPAEALVYTRDLTAGEIVQPEDLAWSKAPPYGVPLNAPRDSKGLIGKAAKRPLRAGAAVSLSDLATPLVIKRDDIVSVAYEAGGVKLVLQAKAMAGASLGQTVDVMNPASKKIVQAVAIGPGQAVVGPAAARVRQDPQLLASLR